MFIEVVALVIAVGRVMSYDDDIAKQLRLNSEPRHLDEFTPLIAPPHHHVQQFVICITDFLPRVTPNSRCSQASTSFCMLSG
jgi:hypothetical protein